MGGNSNVIVYSKNEIGDGEVAGNIGSSKNGNITISAN